MDYTTLFVAGITCYTIGVLMGMWAACRWHRICKETSGRWTGPTGRLISGLDDRD